MNSSAQVRQEKLNERDQLLLQLINEGTPLASIEVLIGTHQDYCKELIRKLEREHGVKYKPKTPGTRAMPPRITDASRKFRAKIGDYLYALRQRLHYVDIQLKTGLCNKAQAQASELPFNYDLRLGQLESLAQELDMPFKEMMLRALLTDQEFEHLSRCWKN